MSSTPWKLEQDLAQLHASGLTAAMDFARPEDGLTRLVVSDASLPGTGLLALVLPAGRDDAPRLPSEKYVRCEDLVAVYEPSEDWPVRADALWRVGSSETAVATIELVVSVRTSLLDSRPQLDIRSALPADEVLWIAADQPEPCRVLQLDRGATQRIDASGGAGCLLFRLAGTDLSYAEMVHPSDFRHTVLRREEQGSVVRAAHCLFATSLEKGVILRGRIRGLFVPREDDVRLAAAEYRAFVVEEPVLGT